MNQAHSTLQSKIADRTAIVGIVGMGYIGLPLMLAVTAKGFHALGFDINPERVRELNHGLSPLKHLGHAELVAARNSGRFEATYDFSRLAEADVIVVCVPTPLNKHREPDLTFIISTAENIAVTLRTGQLIVLESTTFPGTTDEFVRPILEANGLRSGVDFFLAFAPEREDPGNKQFSLPDIPKVVGADDALALALAKIFYEAIAARVIVTSSSSTAEAVKITENVFRAVNIALVNELKIIYSKMGIDIFEVIEAAKTKPFGFMPFYPGPGLGGHCIPIDPFYLTWKAREFDINTRFIELAGEINSAMPQYVVSRLAEALDRRQQLSLSSASILLIGIAYKRDVDDIRESPALRIMELLDERGSKVEFYDPFVSMIPQTRNHPTLAGKKSIALAQEAISNFDAVVILTDHSQIDWLFLADHARMVVDTRNIRSQVGEALHCKFVQA